MAERPLKTRVVFTPAARAQLRAIPQPTALRILHALARLAASGEGDVRQLEGMPTPEFRLRVGVYRARFRHAEGEIQILAVKHRKDAYR